jgi:hypothetical protein
MAAQNQLSSAEVQELIKYLQVVDGLEKSIAQQEANRIASMATARQQLSRLKSEYQDLTNDISDSLSVFKELVSSLGHASSGVTVTTRAYKGIISLAEKLQLHQKGIVNLNEKDLSKLEEKLAIQRQNIINSEEVLKADEQRLSNEQQLKTYEKGRLENLIKTLTLKEKNSTITAQEKLDLAQYRKENSKIYFDLKNITKQLEKTRGYLAEIPGIIQGTDENFRAVEATIRRIQAEVKEQNSLLGLGGSIIAGLGTALDKLGFGKLSQVLGISQATSEMEEFSSKIVKKRSEEANLRYKVEQTQQELEFKGYSQVLQKLEQEQQLTEQIAAARGHLTDAQIKAGFGGRALKNQLTQLETLKQIITQEDRELHQKAQINNQNKVTLGQLAAQNTMYSGMSGHIAVLSKGIASMGSSLFKNLTNPITQATFVVTQLMDAFKAIDSGSGKLAKGMNISYGEALKVREEFADIAKNSNSTFVTTEKLSESYLAISQALGANVKISEKDLDTFTKLREQAGFTNEELIGINKISMATGKSVDDTVAGFMGAGKALAIQKGLSINIKQLMKDTANVSNAIKLSLGATPEALAQAAVKVKELGINLQQADSIANSLLQFESSITAELEAELLTGKEINLENARYYALMGDIGAMAEEINKEIGGSAEFTKMNRIQQEAYAKAVGMSREELANSLVEQEALSKLGRSLSEEEQAAYELAKQQYGEKKAAKMLGEGQLDIMMDQASVQERFTAAVEKLKDVFVSIVDGPLGSMLGGLANLLSNANRLKTVFGAIAGIIAGRMVLGLAMAIPKMVTALALATGRAAAEVTAAEALTMGLATIGILAGLGTVMAALASYGGDASAASSSGSQYTMKDGILDRKNGPILQGDFGEVQLDGNDQVYDASKGRPIKVGTNLIKESPLPYVSNPATTSTQSITATPSLGMPSSTEESQQLNTSISKLTETSQLQIEELKKLNQENKTLNETRTAQEEKNAAVQTKSSSSQVTILTKIAKILETQLMMSVISSAASMFGPLGGMVGGMANTAIGAGTLMNLNQTPETSTSATTAPKLAEGGSVLQEGIAKVDKNEIFLGKNSSEVFKDMYVSLNKISDNTANKLSAVNTLNKTDLTSSLLNTINKTFVDDVVNSETQRIKEENYLTTNNNLQPTPLTATPETKLVAAPAVASNITTNNNEVSTITNNANEITALLAKLDQLLQVNREHKDMYAQYSRTPSKITLDSREFATIQNINTSRA